MNLQALEATAVSLMREHGLYTGRPGGWRFKWDNAKRRAGQTDFDNKVISMSRVLARLWSQAEVYDTLRHEIAHAIAGADADHGPRWKAAAVAVGARPERCAPVSDDTPQPIGMYTGRCPAGHEVQRYRKLTAKTPRISCIRCSPKFDARHLITWHPNEPAAVAAPVADTVAEDAPARPFTFTW